MARASSRSRDRRPGGLPIATEVPTPSAGSDSRWQASMAALDVDSPLACTADLVAQARAGDLRARDELVVRYREPLVRFLHARLPRSARGLLETQDVVQEATAAALLQLDRFEYRGIGSFWSYLRQISLNLVAQSYRRSVPPKIASDCLEDSALAPASPDHSPEAELIRSEEINAFETAL